MLFDRRIERIHVNMDDLAWTFRFAFQIAAFIYRRKPILATIPIGSRHNDQGTRPPSSLFSPLAMIFRAWSSNGLCSFNAVSTGADIHRSNSARVVRMTGIAYGWIRPTIALGSVARKSE